MHGRKNMKKYLVSVTLINSLFSFLLNVTDGDY